MASKIVLMVAMNWGEIGLRAEKEKPLDLKRKTPFVGTCTFVSRESLDLWN